MLGYQLYELLCRWGFVLLGKRPWSFGYNAYKRYEIKKNIVSGRFVEGNLCDGYGFRIDERIVEYPWLFSQLPRGNGRLLDAGSALNYDYLLSMDPLKSKKIFIYTLAPEKKNYPERGISYIYGDLRSTCFHDDYFDWIVSISTVEHIGFDNTMLYVNDPELKECDSGSYLKAILEFYRILKPGGILYITVPYGKHNLHGWFQVFDSSMVDALISEFSPCEYEEFYYKYHPMGWRVSNRQESRDATCFDIHKSQKYDSDYAAFSRAVACLKLKK